MQWPRASGRAGASDLVGRSHGIGDLGPSAMTFATISPPRARRAGRCCRSARPAMAIRPYQLLSAFAGNPLLISPNDLRRRWAARAADLAESPAFPRERVGLGAVGPWKRPLLDRASARLRAQRSRAAARGLRGVLRRARDWLDDYALFRALKDEQDGAAWADWHAPLRQREPAALADARARSWRSELDVHRFTQFLFFRQWDAASRRPPTRAASASSATCRSSSRTTAPTSGRIRSCSSSTPRAARRSSPACRPTTSARRASCWGNPLYGWDAHRSRPATPGGSRACGRRCELVDIIRIDHFRGFEAYWEIPAERRRRQRGRWVPGPGARALRRDPRRRWASVPFIAEDLGLITPEVDALRDELRLPGHGGPAVRLRRRRREPIPAAQLRRRHCVVYTGTHDNDTTRGWFAAAGAEERAHALAYLGSTPKQVVASMIRAALASIADLAIIPLQDVLGLDQSARMNTPAKSGGNWAWRCTENQLAMPIAERLGELTTVYGRAEPRW